MAKKRTTSSTSRKAPKAAKATARTTAKRTKHGATPAMAKKRTTSSTSRKAPKAAKAAALVCAGYALRVVNTFNGVSDDFDLQVIDSTGQRSVWQGSIKDALSLKLLKRIADYNGDVGWPFTATNGVIDG